MFEKFGEFDSVEELNAAAEGLKKEGDYESLVELAKENGLDEDDALDFYEEIAPELASAIMAAQGKISVESKDLEIDGIMKDWRDSVIEECMDNKELCAAVRRKNKSLKECMAKLIQFSFENKVQVSNEIIKVTKVHHNGKVEPFKGPLYLGVPSRKEAKKIIREYYLGKE